MTVVPSFSFDGLDILVVDDDATSCLVSERILSHYGARVQTAYSGTTALELFNQHHHPLVITDICMPGMDGMQLVANLKRVDNTVVVIAATAAYDTERLISAIQLGFNDYILKPIEIEKLLWAVKRGHDTILNRQKLEEEQSKFRTVVESLGDCLAIKDLDYRVLYQNRAMTEKFGDLTGKPCYAFWGRVSPCQNCPMIQTLADGQLHIDNRTTVLNGRMITVETTTSPLVDSRGRISGTVEIIRDISERSRNEQMIRNIARGVSSKIGAEFLESLTCYLTEALEMDFALVGELSEDGTQIRTLAFSRKGMACETFSYQLNGTPCAQAIAHGLKVYRHDVAGLFPDDTDLRTLSIQSYCGAPLIDSRGTATGILCTFHTAAIEHPDLLSDIIRIFASRAAVELERIKNEQIIRDMAFHDHLTGLANRRLFEDRLSLAIATARRHGTSFGLIYLDLDDFKEINDSHGHDMGDRVLVMTGERIRQCCRRDLDTIGRQGGDEFCILLEDGDNGNFLEELAKLLLERIASPLKVGEIEISISASIGIAVYPRDGGTPMELEMAADRAMYAAKQAGRNAFRCASQENDG